MPAGKIAREDLGEQGSKIVGDREEADRGRK